MSADDALVTISTRLTAGQIKRLKELEKIDQVTMARHIRTAVEEYLARVEEKYRLAEPAEEALHLNPAKRRKLAISYR